MIRKYNFSAGPAALPLEVLLQVKEDLPSFHDHGVSIMEVSHRGPLFAKIFEEAVADLRRLMGISDNYDVLFLQGGAQTQFALIPMNLQLPGKNFGYVDSGHWSRLAINEAKKVGPTQVVATNQESGTKSIPVLNAVPSDLSYLHITPNETIHGVETYEFPACGDVPLVGDMSSTILSRPFDVNQFGLIYAGAQKNIGPAGVTLVVIRKDLLARSSATLPSMLNYQAHSSKGSMYNTPPTFAIYLSGLVFKWLIKQGGLPAMAAQNLKKSALFYDFLDQSQFFSNPVEKSARSWMNIPFTLADPALDSDFLRQAEARGLLGLKGHKALGGMRASFYNAVPLEAVEALLAFMAEFEKNQRKVSCG